LSNGTADHYQQLFDSMSRDSEQAFTELFHIFTPKLLPFVSRLTRNEHIAKELIQETFLRLWVDRVNLTEIQNPSAWIYRIASNLSINWLRTQGSRRRIIQKIEPQEATDSVVQELDSKELHGIIQQAVNQLPEKRQEIYRLSREEGLSHQQIAEKLNISPNTVKNQLIHALKSIRESISTQTGLSLITLVLLVKL
jgi:RNA polymerase sigma-70 factor (family 1)